MMLCGGKRRNSEEEFFCFNEVSVLIGEPERMIHREGESWGGGLAVFAGLWELDLPGTASSPSSRGLWLLFQPGLSSPVQEESPGSSPSPAKAPSQAKPCHPPSLDSPGPCRPSFHSSQAFLTHLLLPGLSSPSLAGLRLPGVPSG